MAQLYPSINIEPSKCTGCRMCELACALKKEGEFNPNKARMRVVSIPPIPFYSVVTCLQCAEPSCAEVCPTAALRKDSKTGQVVLSQERCVGCMLCLAACPFGGIFFSHERNLAYKCDHCDGAPECVAVCAPGCLTYTDHEPVYRSLTQGPDLLSPGTSACQGCSAELMIRHTFKILGSNSIVGFSPGCMSGVAAGANGPYTGSNLPVFRPLLANTSAVLTGIKRHYLRKGRKEVKVVAFAGDGATADAGFQSLSGAAERGEPIVYICYDNEGYMNTGFQRSATTPIGAWTPTTPGGKGAVSKDLPMIMAMHQIPYVATANPAFLEDFIGKLTKALQVEDGLSYLHLFTPCPMGWKYPTASCLEVCRLAVATNYFPLWEAERGRFRITVKPRQQKSMEEYLKRMGKFSHLTREEIQKLQGLAEERYRRLLILEATS